MINKLSFKKKGFIIILILLITVFVIKPSITGYSIYQKVKSSNYSIEDYGENIQELKSKLLVSNTNLSSCNEFNKKLFDELEKSSDKSYECNSKLGALETNFNFSKSKYEETLKTLGDELKEKNEKIEELKDQGDKELTELRNEKEEEISDLNLKYELFVQNTANNICCKAKVDNPDIKYYKIESNKIICLEEGTLSISCFG